MVQGLEKLLELWAAKVGGCPETCEQTLPAHLLEMPFTDVLK